MSSPDRFARAALNGLCLPALVVATGLLSACTVRPLYSDNTSTSSTGVETSTATELASIAIKPVESRYAQQVRNHLTFLFTRGGARPVDPAYTLTLVVSELKEQAVEVQEADDNEPSAGTITLTATYILTSAGDGKLVAKGTRRIASSYDIPRQEFAANRAVINAEDRAARELAELLHLTIAQDLARRT